MEHEFRQYDDLERVLVTKDEIAQKVAELGKRIMEKRNISCRRDKSRGGY